MSSRLQRLDRLRFLPLLLLAGLACEDSPSGSARTIAIVEPLTMTWPDQDQGAPYDGGPAVFAARAALRVVWSFRIEQYTAVDRWPRYTQTFENQDRIAFTWSGQPNGGLGDFALGDSCVAWVEFKQMDPAEAGRARVVFRIGP